MLSSVCEWFARDLPLADNMFGHFVMDSLVTLFATIVSFWDLREFDEDFEPDSALLRFRSNFLLRWHLWEDLHVHEMLSNWQQMWNQASRPHAPATEGTGKGSAHLGLGRCKLPSLFPLASRRFGQLGPRSWHCLAAAVPCLPAAVPTAAMPSAGRTWSYSPCFPMVL